MIGHVGLSERSSSGQSCAISPGSTTRLSTPSSWFTSARSVITTIARSEWASVKWPCCEKRRLKSSSADRRSYSSTLRL